ncbi:arsenite methyltransferase [Raphidocelis subcapitata]|uniref:Arsenite methyltransferase n=1 Tax=Raphidocelis subcapitata TaxID=307507 RepID=A0A2V0P7P9_9CHLO|nr:arsenite methyltransferase [Raphidocelis subcapitata]|eukprot:GBF94952.1 arsenite methyltransferase [Raphidocelis subcapitata]
MAPVAAGPSQLEDAAAVRESVSKYYGDTLQGSSDLRTSACCTAKPPAKEVVELLRRVPEEIVSKYYGCGSPFPQGVEGKRILDLGCGTGRDCYVCAGLVGPRGSVTGLDMTDAQLDVARRHEAAWAADLGYDKPNTRFLKGRIEYLEEAGLEAGSVDVVISNCVINLSPEKERCLREVYRVLAPGGEMFFSDVYSDRRLPEAARRHEVALGECLGGALYVNDFLSLCKQVGFSDPRVLAAEPIEVHDAELEGVLGGAKFYSVTFRLFKLPGLLEPQCEEYGQTATYKGTVPGSEDAYTLDCDHTFKAGATARVCGNTAAMLEDSWLAPHFTVMGDRSTHQGQFDCGPGNCVLSALSVASLAGGGGGGSCCAPKPAAAAAAKGGDSCCAPKPAAAAAAKGGAAAPRKCC